MLNVNYVLLAIYRFIFACGFLYTAAWAGATKKTSQTLYQEIGQELLAVRKEHTVLQPRIYSVLDKIDRLNDHLKTTLNKKRTYKKDKNKLEEERKKMQNDVVFLQTSLEATSMELEQARILLEQAKQQKNNVLDAKSEPVLEASLSSTNQLLTKQKILARMGRAKNRTT